MTPALLVGGAILVELLGGVLLILGYQTRIAASLIVVYLMPVTFFIHNFWLSEGAERQSQSESFEKGLMIMGGLLFVVALGAGKLSLDARFGQKPSV